MSWRTRLDCRAIYGRVGAISPSRRQWTIGVQAHSGRLENTSVHGFKNFSRCAHHTTTRDSFEFTDSESLLAPAGQAEPAADAAGLLSESSEAIEPHSLWELVKRGNLGQVLHEVPDGVFAMTRWVIPWGHHPCLSNMGN